MGEGGRDGELEIRPKPVSRLKSMFGTTIERLPKRRRTREQGGESTQKKTKRSRMLHPDGEVKFPLQQQLGPNCICSGRLVTVRSVAFPLDGP